MSPNGTERRQHWFVRILLWPVAVVDSRKQGLSMTRLIAIYICWLTYHLAHDWLALMKEKNEMPGWAFVTFVLALITLSVCTALGGKYVAAFLQSKFTETIGK